MKRIFDIALSFLGLVFCIPFFAIIAIVIYLDDYRYPFFMQYRVGQHGKLFKLIKFRSMSVNDISSNGTFEAGNLSRVTRIGKILRKTKVDELPQLFNVLKGEMSFVGPRPEVKKWVSVYPERWAIVLRVRPGITDYASIEFRSEEEILAKSENPEVTYRKIILPQKLTLNEQYVREQSFLLDLNIIFKTIRTLLIK